eukprot:scaffold33055_cov79-Isochrysis_galbana.AAC.1
MQFTVDPQRPLPAPQPPSNPLRRILPRRALVHAALALGSSLASPATCPASLYSIQNRSWPLIAHRRKPSPTFYATVYTRPRLCRTLPSQFSMLSQVPHSRCLKRHIQHHPCLECLSCRIQAAHPFEAPGKFHSFHQPEPPPHARARTT